MHEESTHKKSKLEGLRLLLKHPFYCYVLLRTDDLNFKTNMLNCN